MVRNWFSSYWIALAILPCLSSGVSGAHIKIPLKEVAKQWLDANGIKDASRHLNEILLAAPNGEKVPLAIANFEKAILDGKPLDPDKHSLVIALNLLRLDDFTCLVVVPDSKDKGITAFTGTSPTVHKSGCDTSDVDLTAIPALKALGRVECRIKDISAKADHFEVVKGMPGTARLTFSLTITVASKNTKIEDRRTIGPFRITAWQDVELRKLEQWK